MFDLIMNSSPIFFQRFQSTAPSEVLVSGGVVEIGTLASLAGHFGRGGICHGIFLQNKVSVICKRVAVNQGPTSSVSFHVTIKHFKTKQLMPIR